MKRAIISRYSQLNDKLTGLVGMMNFRYLNLCIKAEEVSLIPVKPVIEGEQYNLEDLAVTAKRNDYEMMLVPKLEDDLSFIAEGVVKVHPEFKQTVEKMEMEVPNMKGEMEKREVSYIVLTMPEVNDDRFDELMQLTDAINDYTKQQIDIAVANTTTQITPLLVDESPGDADGIKEAIDKLQSEKHELRDKLYNEKQQEIKEAYKNWLASYAKAEIASMEVEDAHRHDVSTNMRMTDHEENSN